MRSQPHRPARFRKRNRGRPPGGRSGGIRPRLERLTCEGLTDPPAIGVAAPRLGWQLRSGRQGRRAAQLPHRGRLGQPAARRREGRPLGFGRGALPALGGGSLRGPSARGPARSAGGASRSAPKRAAGASSPRSPASASASRTRRPSPDGSSASKAREPRPCCCAGGSTSPKRGMRPCCTSIRWVTTKSGSTAARRATPASLRPSRSSTNARCG